MLNLKELTPLLDEFDYFEEKIKNLKRIGKLAGLRKTKCICSLGIKDLERPYNIQTDYYGSLIIPGTEQRLGYNPPPEYDLIMDNISFDSASMLRICDILIREYEAEQEKITKKVEKLPKKKQLTI